LAPARREPFVVEAVYDHRSRADLSGTPPDRNKEGRPLSMTLRRAPLALVFLLAAPPCLAALDKYKDWVQSPESVYLSTDDDKKEWKKITTDEEAEKFVALFWARRDPDLKTPANEFRERFDVLVKKADELFPLGRKRGALTERGKAFILIGPPKSMAQKREDSSSTPFGGSTTGLGTQGSQTGTGAMGNAGATTILTQFLYEKPQLPPWADIQTLDLKFQVDLTMAIEHFVDGLGPAKRLETRAIQMALANPQIKEAPVYKTKEQVAADQKAVADKAAEESKGPAFSDGARATLDGLLKDAKEPFGPLALLPVSYRDGASRLMLQLFVPASAAGTGEGAKLLVLARDKDGKDAVRIEEAAALRKTKADFFTDRAVRVVPGDYDVAAALVDPAGKVVASARRSVTVPPLPTEFSASPLVVAINDFPVEAPKPDEPFTFSARRFVVKGDGKVYATDGLSYAVRLYNPPIDPVSRTVALRRTVRIKPKGQPAIDVPTPPEEPAKVPDQKEQGTLVLDIAGGVVESNLGQYLKPGDYELRVTLLDVASQKKLDLMTPFTVVDPGKK
jgi:GWxTD domain-containing protein